MPPRRDHLRPARRGTSAGQAPRRTACGRRGRFWLAENKPVMQPPDAKRVLPGTGRNFKWSLAASASERGVGFKSTGWGSQPPGQAGFLRGERYPIGAIGIPVDLRLEPFLWASTSGAAVGAWRVDDFISC